MKEIVLGSYRVDPSEFDGGIPLATVMGAFPEAGAGARYVEEVEEVEASGFHGRPEIALYAASGGPTRLSTICRWGRPMAVLQFMWDDARWGSGCWSRRPRGPGLGSRVQGPGECQCVGRASRLSAFWYGSTARLGLSLGS